MGPSPFSLLYLASPNIPSCSQKDGKELLSLHFTCRMLSCCNVHMKPPANWITHSSLQESIFGYYDFNLSVPVQHHTLRGSFSNLCRLYTPNILHGLKKSLLMYTLTLTIRVQKQEETRWCSPSGRKMTPTHKILFESWADLVYIISIIIFSQAALLKGEDKS